jgi:hypothetical protein
MLSNTNEGALSEPPIAHDKARAYPSSKPKRRANAELRVARIEHPGDRLGLPRNPGCRWSAPQKLAASAHDRGLTKRPNLFHRIESNKPTTSLTSERVRQTTPMFVSLSRWMHETPDTRSP